MVEDTTNLSALLKKIATEQGYSNPSFKLSPIPTAGANYTSRLYRAKITSHGKNDLQLFAKVAAITENMRKQFTLDFYDSEQFMYTELFEVYKELEEMNYVSNKHKLAFPKYYGADTTRLQEIIVLEDLSSKGFTVHGHQEPVSWKYAAAAVKELAKLHALSFTFQHNNPSLFNKIATTLQRGMFSKHEANYLFYNSSVNSAMAAVRERNKEKLQRFLDKASLAMYCRMYGALRRPVLIHADFRLSNMMHRYMQDGTLELMIVDYQTIQVGCPVLDLLYFIFTGTDGLFRDKHFNELINYYYSELDAALARLGLDVKEEYSRQDFEFELKEKLPHGLLFSVVSMPLLLAEELDTKSATGLNMAKLSDQTTGNLYTRRLNEVVDDFVAWGVLV